ncbi:MAG TPA: PilT/PilU family type 4a pilus ATPase [Candidatus Omnitrophota bacterium]|nr:PilT/PilU family type 4a pilus ATPase [Candidatus Omnitrophota bacterium]HQO57649.1 PilT/PilU family type 4a pilus ATPase [Candidatus Omnitrophota bacterium]
MDITQLFRIMIDKKASDLFVSAKSLPRARINGVVKVISEDMITEEQMDQIASVVLNNEERKKLFHFNKDIDFIYNEPEVGRFRINLSVERGHPALVARHIKTSVEDFEYLKLPAELLKTFCEESSGLVILSGPAGSGKSTTIASMIDYINNNSEKHIVTIEDPIEFIFADKKSTINQRELGTDVLSYPAALKHVTQQSADIIYIGTIRDIDTMRAAITATELGSFVLTTFHTVNAVQAITRIVNFFPPYLHEEVRMQLAIILKGVISLRLIPLKDGSGRVPAYETMVVTPTISRLIREGKINEIQKFIDDGDLYGMQSFKKSLVHLVKEEYVDEEDARRFADSKDEFNLELKGLKRYHK